jgi:hypothetical protein
MQDWIRTIDRLPPRGVEVVCKLTAEIGRGIKEKVLYRMKHNGQWNDYNAFVIAWKYRN